VDVSDRAPTKSKGDNQLVMKEVTVTTSWEEVESQLEELAYEHFSEEPEDNVNARQPTPRKNKPFQSLFELEDMASPYGGGEWGVWRFSGAAGTIEVEDFKREFTMWCELQKSRNPNFNPYMVWRALFGCMEGAPLANYGEFEAANSTTVVAWRNFYAPNYVDVFGGNLTAVSTSGKGKDKKEEETDMSVAEGQPPPFNPTAKFFLRLFRDYQGQRADKMKALRTFVRGGDESLREAHARLRRLITATHGVTEQQAVQHWYSILDKELKTPVRNETLRMREPPSLRFVFETSERIEINLLEQKAAMSFLKREEKPPEKVKVVKASLPSHAADTNATYFKCGKAGHLRKDCKDGKTTTSQSGGFYSRCGIKGHNEAECWKLHPKLKPMGSKGTKAGGNEKDKETKASTGEKKGWKAKFAELEAKMTAMSTTTTSGGAKPHVTPSFYAGGGFGPDNEEYGNFMMSGMAFMAEDLTLEVFANTRSQTAPPKDTPRGASSNLDPQRGEGNRQARLSESFTLEEMVPTTSMVYPSRVEASSNKPSQRGAKSTKASEVVQEAASLIYQASLFSAAMVSHSDFSPAAVFKRAATMCESGHYTVATTMKTAVDAEQMVESQEDTVQGLFLAAVRVKIMPARPAIERSSIIPGVVVVDNSQGIFQFIGPKGKVFVHRRVLLDSEAQPLMLGASAIEGLGLTKDTLEKCPWTISTSMGGTEHATAITKGELALKLNQDDVEDASFMKVKAIVTEAKSYNILVGSTVLYPMGFTLDFWEETASY
jgi:hypothetical protein